MSSDKVVTGTAGGYSSKKTGISVNIQINDIPNYLEMPPNSTEAWIRSKILLFYSKPQYKVHPGFDWKFIWNPCNTLNVNPVLIMAIAQKESWGGTSDLSMETLNPGNVGNTTKGDKRYFDSWEAGWYEFVNQIHRRIHGLHSYYQSNGVQYANSIENLGAVKDGKRDTRFPWYAEPIDAAKSWINDIKIIFNKNDGYEGFN
jgi:hypothetical protein